MVLQLFVSVVVAFACFALCMAFTYAVDKDMRSRLVRPSSIVYIVLLVVASLSMPVIAVGYDYGGVVPCGLFWGTLAAAAYCDHCCQEIYDVVYLPAIMGCVYAAIRQPVSLVFIVEFVVFCLLQFLLFSRFYGGSDCIAYSVCAGYICVMGGGLFEDALLMCISFGLFVMVQAVSGNIGGDLKLKDPKAVIPYIACGMVFYQVVRGLSYMETTMGRWII